MFCLGAVALIDNSFLKSDTTLVPVLPIYLSVIPLPDPKTLKNPLDTSLLYPGLGV